MIDRVRFNAVDIVVEYLPSPKRIIVYSIGKESMPQSPYDSNPH